jgi:hypothetical protein
MWMKLLRWRSKNSGVKLHLNNELLIGYIVMNSEQAIAIQNQALHKKKYGVLFSTVAALLFEYDPMGINFGENADEYESEVGTILPRLENVSSVEEVEAIVYEEFCHWFEEAGPKENYRAIAEKIWEAWLAFDKRGIQSNTAMSDAQFSKDEAATTMVLPTKRPRNCRI